MLLSDLEESVQEVNQGERSQRERRNFFREIFSVVEGMVWAWKQMCLNPAIVGYDADYSPAEFLMLQDQGYDVDDKGKIKIRDDKFVPLKNNIRFSVSMLEQVTGRKSGIDFHDRGWDSLLSSIKVRHRITHPKNATSLEIADSEFEHLGRGIEWFNDAVNKMSSLLLASLKREQRRAK